MRWFLPALMVACTGGDAPTDETDVGAGWRSALYPAAWAPSFTDPDGRFLHDVSYAGYRHGEALPQIDGPVFDVVEAGADPTGSTDSTAAIQGAIDRAKGGGVVWLTEGTYRVDGLLEVASDGVVIRGAGADRTRVSFTRTQGMTGRAHLTFRGALTYGEDRLLAEDGLARSHAVRLTDTDGVQVGQDVVIGWVISDAFVEDHRMTGTWQAFNGSWRPFFRRRVVDIDGDVVTLDVPLRYPARLRDSASLRVETGHLREVGLEDLSVSTKAPWFEAWAQDRSHAVDLVGVADAWVRGLGSFDHGLVDEPERGERHLQSGGLRVLDSKSVTIADSRLALSQNRGGGGNGYLFEISRSNEILTRDTEAIGGRHNFIQNWDFGTSGCVWLRTVSRDGFAATSASSGFGQVGVSEFHHSLAMANLIDDSVVDDGWAAVNRRHYSSGAGHAATETVFWNLRGTGEIRSFQAGFGYVIGTDGLEVRADLQDLDPFRWSEGTEPADWVEGVDAGNSLEPLSLYEDMRQRRLDR